MKTLVVMFCFLATSAALAQVVSGGGVMSNEPVVVQVPSHPAHASQEGMGPVQNIMERSDSLFAQGERPLWEVAPKTIAVPLGDTARMLKKEQLTAKKASKVWEN
jgi:hypothetical protein